MSFWKNDNASKKNITSDSFRKKIKYASETRTMKNKKYRITDSYDTSTIHILSPNQKNENMIIRTTKQRNRLRKISEVNVVFIFKIIFAKISLTLYLYYTFFF